MRSRIAWFAGAAVAAGLVLSGQAALAEPAAAGVSWTGPYVGAHFGGVFGSRDMKLVPGGYDTVFGPGSQPEGNLSPDGVAGGALAGYNAQTGGPLVTGIEVEIGGNSATGSTVTSATAGWPAVNKMSELWTVRARGRVGWALGPWLPFVATGVSITRSALDLSLDCFGVHYEDHEAKTLVGYNVGAGVEYMIAPGISARLEYIYDDYGSPQFATIKPDWNDRKFTTLADSTVRAAVAYHF